MITARQCNPDDVTVWEVDTHDIAKAGAAIRAILVQTGIMSKYQALRAEQVGPYIYREVWK